MKPEELYRDCSKYEFEEMISKGLKKFDKHLKQLYYNYNPLKLGEKHKSHVGGVVFS